MNLPAAHPESILDITKLPALPQVLVDLIEACDQQEVDLTEIGGIIGRDPGLSARVIQLANSALFGTRSTISEIEQAVVFLGLDTVRNLAVSVSVHEVFGLTKTIQSFRLGEFWYHALLSAVLCKLLAEKGGYAKPAEAYLAGLLHDIGKLLLLYNFPGRYAAILEDQGEASLQEKESTHIGMTHSQAGGMLLRSWKLTHLAEVIEQHHTAECVVSRPVELLPLLVLARALMQPEKDRAGLLREQEVFSEKDLEELLDQARNAVQELASILAISVEAPAPEQPPPAAEDSGRERLSRKVLSMARIQGLLHNLLTAQDYSRIYRVIEQSMAILFNIKQTLVLLPEKNNLRIHCSPYNTCHHRRDNQHWEAASPEASIIASCQQERAIRHCTRQGKSAACLADRLFLDDFGSEALLAVPLPLDSTGCGVLLCGCGEKEISGILAAQETLFFFAAHAGSRILQEQFKENYAKELARKELQVAENIARGILHEIVNPLATIQNALAVVDMKISAREPVVDTLRLIGGEIERIGRVAGQLRSLSETTQEIRLQSTNLNRLATETVALFQKTMPSGKDIHIATRLDPALPEFFCSPDSLRQVLGIVLHNAVEALGRHGSIQLVTRLQAGTNGNNQEAVIEVSDNGPGVATHLNGKIFEAGITSKGSGHLGLGLNLARKQMTALGGSIICLSNDGKGCTFRLTVPIPATSSPGTN